MGLKTYRAKRDLKKTPEPGGAETKKDGPLIFVVQRHKASHLHYDFRLEVRGVLKSWAVPKGPSMDPGDKRLAMMVEDHPYDYKDFKGVIPEGNYGAGIVEIWDHGTYTPLDLPKGKDAETVVMHGIKSGSVKVVLKGRKLKGEFALVRMKKAGENAWLLIKHRDEYSVDGYDSEAETPKSSPINKALAKEEKQVKKKTAGAKATAKKKPTKVIPSKKKNSTPRSSASATKAIARRVSLLGLANARKVKEGVKPMLATLGEEPFDDDEWLFEIKWDGYRAVAETNGKSTRLYSRNGLSFLDAYPAVAKDLQAIKKKMVLDGEVIAVDEFGRPDFQLLQHAAKDISTAIAYQVFDLLELDGKDLSDIPLVERKKILQEELPKSDHIRYCDHVKERGKEFFKLVKAQDLEGVIAKRMDGRYVKGVRSKTWLKIKNHHSQEVVIGGWTAPRNSRTHFGALLLGVYDGEKLRYVGHTGTGFDQRSLKELATAMAPLQRKTSPFAGEVEANETPTWVTPKLVANVKFTEWTRDRIMRHPVFLGLRVDKDAKSVHAEKPKLNTAAARKNSATPAHFNSKPAKKIDANTRDKKVGRHTVHVTNQNKVFWPKEGYTKGDVVDYYERMATVLLPHLKDRPQSLYRTPNGIKGKGFFQKDAGDAAPSWVRTLKVPTDSRGGDVINYILCNDAATLLYMANLGCIELDPWTSRKQHLDKPDHLVMDLDPSKGNDLDDVVEAALAVKVVLDRIGLKGFCKTSGSTGIHVYIPLNGRLTYDALAPVAKDIMRVVHNMLPKTTTMERSIAKRGKSQIYLDHLQNRKGQTVASVYSIRPKPGATVSTPLEWDEVKPGLDLRDFNIETVPQRVKEKGDLFKEVLTIPRYSMNAVRKALNELLE